VQSAVISPDSRWLVTGLWIEVVFSKSGNDSYARLYDLQSDDPWKHSVVLRGHQNKLSAVTFSPDSRYLATGSFDGAVKLWQLDDIADGKVAPTLTNSAEGQVTALEFDSGSKRLLSASKDGTARVWYVSDTVVSSPMVLSTSQKEVDQATASPRGDWIATSGDDLSGWLWPASPDKIIRWACKAAGNASSDELSLYLTAGEQRTLCPK
jgi:WD40 repeat protein